MKHDDYLLSFQGTPDFSADEAAALWCGIDPYSQQAEYFYESAFHSLYDPARRAIMLANASDKKKQYYSIYAYIHGAMATTNAQPQRQDKISRAALVEIANTLQEKPTFLFPNGSADNQQSSIDKSTPVKLMQKKLIEAVREHLQEQKENDGKTNRMEALRDMRYSGELRRIGYAGNETLPKVRKLTDPNQVKEIGLKPLPKS